VEIKDVMGRVEKMLRRWPDIEDAVKEAKTSHGGHSGGAGHSRISDPTACTAIRRVEELRKIRLSNGYEVIYPERWLKSFTTAMRQGDSLVRRVMIRRYKLGESYIKTAVDLSISERTYYSLVEDTKTRVALVAVQLGLIKVLHEKKNCG